MTDYRQKILVVDDKPSERTIIREIFSPDDYLIFEAADGSDAVEKVLRNFFDLVLMDDRMSLMDGIEALKEIRLISPAIPVMIIADYPTTDNAVAAFRAGALDYLIKPLDGDGLRLRVRDYFESWTGRRGRILERYSIENVFHEPLVIGQSPEMKEVLDAVVKAAPTEASVLILGESGTQKELIANAIHRASARATKPFITVNCGAFPEALLEMELFGHEKGTFMGARRAGKFELADGGTLFLEEITETTRATQTKLLQVLQKREFEPLGSTRTVKVNIRIITATKRIIKDEVKKGTFREDLFYRLNVVPIQLPPLRERKEDVPILIEHFLKIYNEKNSRKLEGFHPRALDALIRYYWPGNIRELENVVERSVILTTDYYVPFSQLPEAIRGATGDTVFAEISEGIRPGMTIREMEKELIIKTLEDCEGNRTRTARVLGITRRTLQLKLKEYGIGEPDENPQP